MRYRLFNRLTLGTVVFALSVSTSPISIVSYKSGAGAAFANKLGGHRGGFSGAPKSRPSGARTRPSGGGSVKLPSRGGNVSTRPSVSLPSGSQPKLPISKPAPKPSTPVAKPPSVQPAPKPGGGGAVPPIAGKPGGERPPGARPPGTKPPEGGKPPDHGGKPPGDGDRPPGSRPPGSKPPGPPPPSGGHPPGWHPPGSRPPGWRPPPGPPPPYYRPPDHRYGNYYWNDSWGWFFTAAIVGSTIAFATSLPDDKQCKEIRDGGETLYECDGVLYRSTYYDDEQVYEIVSDPPGEDVSSAGADSASGPQSVFGMSLTDPLTRGDLVRDVQNRLVAAGYDVGGVDGVYGTGTETAMMWFQYDLGIEPTGVIDVATAEALGYDVPEGMKEAASQTSSDSDSTVATPSLPSATPPLQENSGDTDGMNTGDTDGATASD